MDSREQGKQILIAWGVMLTVWFLAVASNAATPPKVTVKHEPVTEELMRQYNITHNPEPIQNYFVYDRLAGKRYHYECRTKDPGGRDNYCTYDYNTSGAVD